jgi:hypothetical protein
MKYKHLPKAKIEDRTGQRSNSRLKQNNERMQRSNEMEKGDGSAQVPTSWNKTSREDPAGYKEDSGVVSARIVREARKAASKALPDYPTSSGRKKPTQYR